MRNQIFTRTTAAVIAIAMLMTLAVLTTPGNNALGQNLPTIGFEDINVSVDEPDQSPYRVNAILTVQLSQASSQNVSVRYRHRRHHRRGRRAGLQRRHRHPLLQPRDHRADHLGNRPERHQRREFREVQG